MTDATADKIYDGYEEWKGWSDLFSYTDDEGDYYYGETRNMAIRGARILEIGFGSGSFLQWAADNGASVSGTEINPVLADAARDRGFEILHADIAQIAAEHAGHFDTIVAFDVFEHLCIAEIKLYLDATEKMLKPGGHLLLRFPNGQSPFGLVAQHGDYTHRTALSSSIFDQLIKHRPYILVSYRRAYNARGRSWATMFARLWRSMAKKAVSRALNMIFANRIIYDPVVVLVLKKHNL